MKHLEKKNMKNKLHTEVLEVEKIAAQIVKYIYAHDSIFITKDCEAYISKLMLKALERQEADHKASLRKMLEGLRTTKKTEDSLMPESEWGFNHAVQEFNTKIDILLKKL